jgi:integrase
LIEAAETGAIAEEDADLLLEFLDACDENVFGTQAPEVGTKAYSTLAAYAQNPRLTAAAAETPLAALTAGELNQVYSDMGKRLTGNTVQQRQSSARVFYRYHSELGVDPDAIHIVKSEPSAVDPRDLFTRDEIDAMHAVIDNPRDRAIVDMCLYTGQRIRALQTLKVTDVDVEEGRFYLNPRRSG